MITGNPDKDFFEQNPELKYKTEFKKLLEEYPKEASKVAWATYLLEDPNSKFYRVPREERLKEVENNYYKIDYKKFKWFMDAYSRNVLTKEQSMFKIHCDKLDELTAFLKELSLDDESQFKKYISIMDKLPKIWDAFETIKTKMNEEESKSKIRGGAKESSREKRRR